MKNKKIAIILAIIAIIALGIFIFKKSAITGFFVTTKETPTLFDVNVEVLPDYKKIFQGEELLIQTTLFNLSDSESVDANIKYSIKDAHGSVIATEEEVVTFETQAKFVRKLLIPSDLRPGSYVAFVEVGTSDGLVGTSSDLFEVETKYERKYLQIEQYALGLAVVCIIGIAIISSLNVFKKIKKKKNIIELKAKIPKEKIQKLKKELKALERAYRSKLISKESYKKDKDRIKKQLKKVRKIKK